MSGVFIAGLTTSVGARDELEIIVDRRHAGSTTNQPPIERRHRDHVVRALERDGFAVVPTPTASMPSDAGPAQRGWPVEYVAPEETYGRQLERVLWLKRSRIIRLSRLLILSALMNAILVAFLVLPAVKGRLTLFRQPASPPSAVTPAQPIGERGSSLPAARSQP